MAEMAVQGLLEFWPCKSVNNPNFGLPIGIPPKFLRIETAFPIFCITSMLQFVRQSSQQYLFGLVIGSRLTVS